MKLVLDTNAVSALMKGDARIVEKLRQHSKTDVTVPQPVWAEIAYGIERLPPSKPDDQGSRARCGGLVGPVEPSF